MEFRTRATASLLAVGATAAIVVAPIAAAAPASGQPPGATSSSAGGPTTQQTCVGLGGTQSQCQSPDNVQINDSPPQVDYFPYAGGAT